mmetsp:Transcript_13325/g.40403  ORF Transcript_13325/g.40403 Transcript_13325/m.40403 type:complete len:315 (-) Transcript_13325:696-1640(-)
MITRRGCADFSHSASPRCIDLASQTCSLTLVPPTFVALQICFGDGVFGGLRRMLLRQSYQVLLGLLSANPTIYSAGPALWSLGSDPLSDCPVVHVSAYIPLGGGGLSAAMEGFALSAADKASDALLRLPGLKGLVICRGGSRLVLIAGFESAQDSARATRSPTWRVFDALAGRPISQTLDEDRTAEWSPHSILANASSSVCHDDVAAQGDAHPATSITTGTVSSRRHSMLPGSCRIAPFASSLRTGMLCWPLRDHSIRNSVVLMRHWSTRTWGMACTLRYSGIFKTTPAAEFAVSLAFGMGVYHGLIRLVQRRL